MDEHMDVVEDEVQDVPMDEHMDVVEDEAAGDPMDVDDKDPMQVV
jgi:hypothetical protein